MSAQIGERVGLPSKSMRVLIGRKLPLAVVVAAAKADELGVAAWVVEMGSRVYVCEYFGSLIERERERARETRKHTSATAHHFRHQPT